ncbi:MAG: GNAT family N-acetyltransferase [Alphaproteobacteria bacterium]|nr:GNAT family N-acetyltransferase [Alphaproteobacteria bacterium]MDD9919647.1 GNAT family N-acetyltransferase [Alphaproteobacteria bacterium]
MLNVSSRVLTPEDWEILREIRLYALRESAHAFGSNYQREAAFTEEQWVERLASKRSAIFGLFSEGGELIGIGCILQSEEDASRAGLFMAYIRPEYRKKGLSKLLYEERIAWAKNHPEVSVIFTHNRKKNIAAQQMNQSFGFVKVAETEPRQWADGAVERELIYELRL